LCTEQYHAQYTTNYINLDNKLYCASPKWNLYGRSCTGCGRKFVDKIQCNPETEFCPSNSGTHTRAVYHCRNLKPLQEGGSCSHAFCQDCFSKLQGPANAANATSPRKRGKASYPDQERANPPTTSRKRQRKTTTRPKKVSPALEKPQEESSH
jgi:hypothetical protein